MLVPGHSVLWSHPARCSMLRGPWHGTVQGLLELLPLLHFRNFFYAGVNPAITEKQIIET